MPCSAPGAPLTPDEQVRFWQQRGQTAGSGTVTLWEQYAWPRKRTNVPACCAMGPTYAKLLYAPYIEVERVPAEHAARAGGRYAYRAWHEENSLLDGSVRTGNRAARSGRRARPG